MISKSLVAMKLRTFSEEASASNDANGSATSLAVKVSVKTRLTASGILVEGMKHLTTLRKRK
jgi:hypothetical protein